MPGTRERCSGSKAWRPRFETMEMLRELEKNLGSAVTRVAEGPAAVKNYPTYRTNPGALLGVAQILKQKLGFEFLDFITAIDWKAPVELRGYITNPNPNPFLPEGATPQTRPSAPTPGVFYREAFEAIYAFSSWQHRLKILLRVELPRHNPRLPSLTSLWQTADWQEREVFDLMGLEFEGHPNLKKLLTPEFIQGHPLRKDYVHQKDQYD